MTDERSIIIILFIEFIKSLKKRKTIRILYKRFKWKCLLMQNFI